MESNKSELIKQVIVLSIILVVVIVFAIVLNVGKKDNLQVKEKVNQTNSIENTNNNEQEILKNLKGLMESNEEEQNNGIPTGKKETIKNGSNETIQYEEVIYGDN